MGGWDCAVIIRSALLIEKKHAENSYPGLLAGDLLFALLSSYGEPADMDIMEAIMEAERSIPRSTDSERSLDSSEGKA